MPLLTAGLQEMPVLTATSHTTLRSQRHRGTAVAAFGTTQPLLDKRWLLIDGVAMLVRDDLVRSGMFMQGAAMTTRAFWPEWTIALAHIEHRDEPWLFNHGGTQRRHMVVRVRARETIARVHRGDAAREGAGTTSIRST
jgi:hypothetical protein